MTFRAAARLCLASAIVLSISTISASADGTRVQPSLDAIRVYPPNVQLTTARDRQSVIVQASLSDGTTRDVTRDATFSLSAPLARIEKNLLHPLADGQGELRIEFGGQTAVVPLVVRDAAADRPVSFRLDVMPVFMKAGCNMGNCHGAARGKDGFRLSLFGFDPEGDYFRLTREFSGRRINLASPADSLILEKATGEVPHTGMKRFEKDSPHAAELLRWVHAGAPNDAGEVPRPVSVEVYPPGAVLSAAGETQQLNVRAKYSDGTDRDVSSLAYFLTSNDNSAIVEQTGLVTAKNRGEAFLMARFATQTVGSPFIVLSKGLADDASETQERNYVDRLTTQKLKRLRIQPSDLCTDDEFQRRATLDITGQLPTVDEYRQFTRDADPRKREKLVDRLLERKEFVELWVMKWAELLQIRTNQQITDKSMLRYYTWLQERVASNVPVNLMIRELLSSSGGTFSNAATNYYQNETDMLKTAENAAQVFLGMRIQCAQCHNHPFDRWTMDDYYSFAAFFSQIGRKPAEDPREIVVFNSGSGEVRHPVGGRVMVPKFLGGDVPNVQGKDRRAVLAEWLASKENPFFARNLTNLVWAHFFGRGIIEPVDDVRVSNPPANPELLDALSAKFAEYDFDLRRLVRDICVSVTYQRSTQTNRTNEGDERNFSHATLRRLRSEVLLDCLSAVTQTKDKFPGLPLGARAVQIANGNTTNYFLTTFGRATRESVCSCEVVTDPNLSQALHLLNGDNVNRKIQEGKLVEERLAAGKTPDEIIEELYIRCLTRTPTPKERSSLKAILAEEKDDRRVLGDVFWALLNSGEFLFNH